MKILVIGSKKFCEIFELIGCDKIEVDEKTSLSDLVKEIKERLSEISLILVEQSFYDSNQKLDDILTELEISWLTLSKDKVEMENSLKQLEDLSEKTLGIKLEA